MADRAKTAARRAVAGEGVMNDDGGGLCQAVSYINLVDFSEKKKKKKKKVGKGRSTRSMAAPRMKTRFKSAIVAGEVRRK